jgi:peptide/nickel transport system permease protein
MSVNNQASPANEALVAKPRSALADFFVRLVREKPLGTVGGVIVLILLVVGILANFIAPYGMNEIHLADRLQPSSARYLLGTDSLGRDVLSRIIYGARISMIVSLAGSALATVVSTAIGLVSGFFGGKTDLVIQRFVDAWVAFPALIILLTVMAIIGGGLTQVTLVLGIVTGIGGSRLIRSAVMPAKENVYVEAARAIGARSIRILGRHLLPNISPLLIVYFTVGMAGMIVTEAALSFLGFGVPPPAPSWGGMLSQEGRTYMLLAPWLALWPGLALSIAVYGINIFGDALRDLLDPRLKGGLGRYGTFKKKVAP